MARQAADSAGGPMDRLKSEVGGLVGALGDRAVASLRDKVEDTAGRLTDYVEDGGGPGIMAAVTGARNLAEGKSPVRSMLGAGMAGVKEKIAGMFGRGGKGGQKKLKLTNIVESVDVGVPVTVAYNQWTQFSDFPKFMKKLENVDRPDDEEQKTSWKAQVFWSHRTWEATVVEQVPDERIIWRSKGAKGHVDGAVTFHELAPSLTRILLILEYHPQGLFEHTGNLWRAQGRRARLELKHFQRHMMTEGVLHADEIEGWRGTIQDGEVVESHEDAMAREEQQERSRQNGSGQAGEQRRAAGRSRGQRRRTVSESEAEAPPDREDEPDDERANGERPRRSAGQPGSSGRGRRPAERSRASGRGTGQGTERRQRSGAAAQRGGSK
jgi:uncharacterized membrane protein